MDQPDQVRQPKESVANWLAHRGPMGKHPPGTQINGALPITSLYFGKKKIPIALSSIVPKEKKDRNR
ncbi:hypothetical protein CSV67_07880 [Sporosarcina sp. P2]|uniref:hypothetical protein n=1 Tax=Sporosarcina sp. P2 TaxID=2048251 RepID=UPI000C16E7F7|nr:hypothetical protein [Sporosarcina sp. P2]PID02548.1 hypothetical protein CSV67_07880 [Sporosarcina sp. P2]